MAAEINAQFAAASCAGAGSVAGNTSSASARGADGRKDGGGVVLVDDGGGGDGGNGDEDDDWEMGDADLASGASFLGSGAGGRGGGAAAGGRRRGIIGGVIVGVDGGDGGDSDSDLSWAEGVELPPNEVEIDVECISALPSDVRKRVIESAQRQQRMRSRETYMAVAADPAQYSGAQIANFLKASALNKKIVAAASSRDSDSVGRRIASDANRKYVITGGSNSGGGRSRGGRSSGGDADGERRNERRRIIDDDDEFEEW
ncbi:unnamed protein product, partial [Phaeothamnion confervicola]